MEKARIIEIIEGNEVPVLASFIENFRKAETGIKSSLLQRDYLECAKQLMLVFEILKEIKALDLSEEALERLYDLTGMKYDKIKYGYAIDFIFKNREHEQIEELITGFLETVNVLIRAVKASFKNAPNDDENLFEEEALMKAPKRIIAVDDVIIQLESIKNRLQKYYEVYPAQSSEKLFLLLEKFIPDLILLDINMPEVNGYEILEMLKADARYAEIPVILLTSITDRESLYKGIKLGAVDFIIKPFKLEEIIECIEFQLNPDNKNDDQPVILSVDDAPATLQSIFNALHEQYKVYTLPIPEKVPDLLKKITPNLFLLDYNMPRVTGFDLVPIIRAFPRHEKTPIIFLTSEGTMNNISEAIRLGASDFLIKPVDDEKLREKIASYSAEFVFQKRMDYFHRKLSQKAIFD